MKQEEVFNKLGESLEWVSSSGIASIIIAGAAVFIAYQQYRLAQNKFKHDLYSKRLKIYLDAEQFLFSVERDGKITEENFSRITVCVQESTFLIRDEDYKYLKSFSYKARELQDKELNPQDEISKPKSEKKESLRAEIREIKDFFYEQHDELKRRFEKYLRLDKI